MAAAAGVELREDPWEMNLSGRAAAAATTPRCSRTCSRAGRRRSTSSPARSSGRRSAPGSRRRCDGGLPAREGARGLVLVRVCVVGCGAVGSLFAANLAQLDDVEVWAYDLDRRTSTRSTATGCGSPAPATSSGACARRRTPPSCRPATSGSWRRRRCTRRAAIAADRARVRGRRRLLGAERGRQRGGDRRARRARDPRDDLPGGPHPRAGACAVGREGRHDARPVRAEPRAARARSSGSPRRAPAPGCRRTRSRDARGPQWRKVIFNAPTNPVGALTGLTHGRVCERPELRRLVTGLVDEGKAVAAAQGIELDADPEELIDHAARPDVAYDHKASMLQDVEARRRTEVDWLNGGIVRFGARARRADAAERGDRGAGERSGAIVVRGRAAVRAGAGGGGARAGRRRDRVRERVHGLRGRGALPVRIRHRPPLRARAAAARRGAVDRLPRRGALRRRARAVVDRRPGLRGHAGRVAAQALRERGWSASASTGSTT